MSKILKYPNNSGFTLLELIVVIAIISVLTAMSVPYYNDYITDSRVSVLKQNMANIRKVVNQFRGDQGRGPFLVKVMDNNNADLIHESQASGLNGSSELFTGAIQIISQTTPHTMRRTNLKYLPSAPVLSDPADGSKITTISNIKSSAYFVDVDNTSGAGVFDMDKDFAYLEGNNNTQFNATFDSVLYNFTGNPDSTYDSVGVFGVDLFALDYIDFTVQSSEGTKY